MARGPRAVKPPARDPALDVVRGVLQVWIMASHAFTSFTSLWLIHAAWGVSDSSEQFVFLSGYGLGSVFMWKQAQGGFAAASADLARRFVALWRMHMLVFLGFGTMVAIACTWLGAPGWALATARPLEALLGGALTLYQPPPFMGILPLFLYGMLALPLFSLLLDRCGAGALAVPAAMWTAAQFLPPDVPALGGTTLAFHPLAWVALFLLGVFFGRRVLVEGRSIGHRPALVVGAIGIVVLGVVMRVVHWTPDILVGKEQLAPLRLLHALSCAYLVVVFLPRGAWARAALPAALGTIGRNSLHAFSLGLFCSYLTVLVFQHVALPRLVAEPAMLLLSATAMWLFARHVEAMRADRAAAPRARPA
ncbi:OpgC domain-containing protein [Falsiroseomonas oryzae]|uniref:OpgC domain-containing protein n=1 Tax=Falsiroseomonas oryzae TaxID=2766473 RepID=UPI0022EA4219|nr:OpgC domain-containing protein [Roseomonas sp. MO-31]